MIFAVDLPDISTPDVSDISAFDIFYFGLIVVGLGLFIVWVFMLRTRAADVGDTPESWGQTADDRRWEKEADDSVHKSLATIRAVAKSWGETVGVVLGVFSIAAFVKGPDAFTEVKGGEAETAALIILLAAVVAAAAVLFAALAAQDAPEQVANLDGWALRKLTHERAARAARRLAISRGLTLLAFLLVLASIGLIWLTALEERDVQNKDAQKAIVTFQGDSPGVCGELQASNGVLTVKPPEGNAQVVRGNASVTLVEDCP